MQTRLLDRIVRLLAVLGAILLSQTHADEVNYSVGILRIEFAPAETAPTLQPLAVLQTIGVRTERLDAYDEQKNINGAFERPVLLAKSGEEAVGRWSDVAVPFSTEQFWIETLKQLEGVKDVWRKPIHGVRGSDAGLPKLSVSQSLIDRAEAPHLEFVLNKKAASTAIEEFFAFSKSFYGEKNGVELEPLGGSDSNKSRSAKPRLFAFDRLWEKLFDDPPWQRLRITARVDQSKADKPILKLIFVGFGGYGPSFAPPQDSGYKNLLSDEKLTARFGEHVERFGGAIRARLRALEVLAE